jgi:LacI family gluconate utilization system Gnt-I transcriptional repressor
MKAGGRSGRVRMVDVAQHAGVGTITVSRALRTPERVSPEVRQRVLKAMQATGYVPNLAAGTLKSQRSRVVAAVVPTLRNTIFAETVDALADGLRAHGFQLLIANSGYSLEAEESILLNLLGQQPVAVVLTGTAHTSRVRSLLRSLSLPVVETWDLSDDPIDRAVGFSNFEAARSMTLTLAARGYQRIAFAGAPPEREHRGAQRLAGYRQALAELGRRPQTVMLEDLGVTFASGERAVRQLLGRARPPDAVFFVNDVAAFGAAQACVRMGVEVPGQLAIAGFGDFELASASNPPLTTVRIPGERIGQVTAQLIVDGLVGPVGEGRSADAGDRGAPAGRSVDLGFEIVSRDSA